MENRVFLLSPASCRGKRAHILMRDAAAFPLAQRVRGEGATLGEVFTFLSGLYFRGKLAYAERFGRPPGGVPGALVITPDRGLVPPATVITLADLLAMKEIDIALANAAYREPLLADAARLAGSLGPDGEVVLLGSIATAKYTEVLVEAFGDRVRFPAEFAGRGDMSRGGLLLRCVDDARELTYAPLDGAPRRGPRPPKLAPRTARARGRP